ncbi:hypothetical protein U4I94_22660, partial [Stenotrophomonas maltophilia]|uniref:hypothetical protein n=1 Tax=Stenotrophomonas maltophilia TaxID=40324 RepID=UPI002ACD1E0F
AGGPAPALSETPVMDDVFAPLIDATLRVGVLNLGDVSTLEEGNNYDGGARTLFVGATARF